MTASRRRPGVADCIAIVVCKGGPMLPTPGNASSAQPALPVVSICHPIAPSPIAPSVGGRAEARPPAALTARERQVAAYLAAGKANKVIAIDLGISRRTAEAHRARIFRKLGVRNAFELACRMCPHRRAATSMAGQGATPASES
ncbi:transcriptional regulator, LuxR family [Bordetella bronchiseptica CA90 BB1334]|nr:transcriptional regulator, LuxR family [Bordetella bronchiseptica 00-P-2730]KDB79257.1 transcriptional regulator, LuxR family [Bordetella bronchiseptica CA90 BB1334]